MKLVLVISLLLLGCATTSRWHCEEVYCEPPPCAIEDKYLVSECIERHLERKRSVVDWFGSVGVGIGHLFAAAF